MKVALVFLAIIGLSLGAPSPKIHSLEKHAPKSLIDDLLEFLALLPIDDIKAIADDHLATDGAFAAVIVYLQGDEWAALVDEVGSKPAVQDFIKYLTDAGLPVDVIIAWIHDLIHNAVPGVDPDENGSLRPLLDEIEAILPVEDLINLLNDKMQNSPDFQDLYTTISSEKAKALVEEVRAIDEVQRLAQRLRDFGVKVDETLAIIYEWLGWGEPKKSAKSLIDDLLEFLALLPIDDIKSIADDHLATDGAFAAVIVYLQGDEWAALVDEVGSKPAVQDFIKYLTDAGLPVDVIIAWIHDLIHNAVPGVDPDENGSLRPLLDEIEAILPVEDLINLLNDKMQNSPDFQDLYTTISSEKAKALVEEVRAIDEVQRLAQRLRDFGVKVDETLAIIYEWLGWGEPKKSAKSLIDDLLEFLALLPIDDIKAIADDHLATDGAFAAVIVYLQGDEWAALVDEVGSKPAVQDFIKYLTDAGLPVDVIIAWIHDLIHNAVPGVDPDENGSLRPLLDEIEAILPVEDLINLLNDKMQNSPDFQDLYTTISSEKAKALVEEVRAIDEVQRLAQRLRDFGVKVDETLAIIYEWLGWGEPKKSAKSLIDDLLEFLALLPIDDIKAIADDHLATDGAFAAVIVYLQGDEWAALVDEVGSKPAVQDFIKYLTDAGLPVDVIIAWIHDLIHNAVPGVDPDEDGSLRPLLDEIEAILPVEDLINLLNDKMQNSPDFQDLYTTISSEKAKALVEEVRAIDEVQRLAQRLRDFGVKVDETLAIIYEWLGWGEPKRF